MKKFSDFLEGRCWPGYKPKPGKPAYSPGSCVKEDSIEEKWTQKYKNSIDCSHPKGFSQKAHCAGEKKNLKEDLRKWFSKTDPKGDWKRINSKGEAIGPCAREPGEPKPKCMSKAQRASLSKKERASAVRRKREQDPNPERQGKPIDVKSKVNENMEQLNEKNKPTNPELWSRAVAQARAKFDVYPSAYANGWASKWYKEHGGGWKSVSEAAEVGDDPVNQGTPDGLSKRGNKTMLKKFKDLSMEGAVPSTEKVVTVRHKTSGKELRVAQHALASYKVGGYHPVSQVKEAKDEEEYGYEGDMALNQLKTLVRCAEMIEDLLKPDTDLPEWVQSKITLATDYMQTAADYLYSEMKEEVQINELSSELLGRYKTGAVTHYAKLGAEMSKDRSKVKPNTDKQDKRYSGILKATNKQFDNDMKKEEVEQQDEAMSHQAATTMKHIPNASPALKKVAKDIKPGVGGYRDRIDMLNAGGVKKEEVMVEREDDEYHTPSRHHVQVQVSKGDGPKEHRKATVRAKEPQHAVSAAISHYKQQGYTVHDHKYLGEETIQEGRPSQRHPLEGHEYHKKSDEALVHIAKDAHAAAEAMKGHNTTAENKYRDQANDSATVRHYRKTNGMPEWYKKKYGHVNEATETKDDKPPFDGPYKKSPGVITDKSGAKHGPMSRARDLARQAAKRQAGNMKTEEKEKSRKAQIVKGAMKSKDKFEKDPIITDTTVKTDNLQ